MTKFHSVAQSLSRSVTSITSITSVTSVTLATRSLYESELTINTATSKIEQPNCFTGKICRSVEFYCHTCCASQSVTSVTQSQSQSLSQNHVIEMTLMMEVHQTHLACAENSPAKTELILPEVLR